MYFQVRDGRAERGAPVGEIVICYLLTIIAVAISNTSSAVSGHSIKLTESSDGGLKSMNLPLSV
jgi:hypothetical protein